MALEYSFMLEKVELSDDDIIIELGNLGIKIDTIKIERLSKGIQITETYDKIGFSLP
ncbi:hypothetical protein [Paenibacillus xylaniclasticus]|uniref:hypothetical protein n=1 Tax=Paenibacillus xylaniclasticus TaxID=588083 RepID=UPI0013DEDB9E|nr:MULTISPECIES: hypothetical protein [Paenibacillus]GFN31585.1 hypothetical protein PCURB6_18450 [Paenibacillus curdlanolyticus]